MLASSCLYSNPASTIPEEEASAPARSQALSSGNAAARYSRVSFPLSAADLPPSPTKSSNLSETAEVPACNVPSRSPLPALAIAPETKLASAIQGSNVPNPDEAVPSFVSGAMAQAGKGLLEGTLQAGTSAVSDKLLDLVGLGGKSAADKGKDTRDYLAAAFPELNAWERAG